MRTSRKGNVFEPMVITPNKIELRQYINLYGNISFLLRYENTRNCMGNSQTRNSYNWYTF